MSLQRSGRGASRAAATPRGRAAAPAGQRGVFVQTPKSDIYVVMLGVALGAIVLGCILLLLHLNRYEFKTKAAFNFIGPTAPSAVDSAHDSPLTSRLV